MRVLPLAAVLFASVSFAVSGVVAQEAAPPAEMPAAASELDELSASADDVFETTKAAEARKPVSVTIRALNKVTAKCLDLVVPMEETVGFGSLDVTARYCDKRPPEEFPETTAFLQIRDRGRAAAADGAPSGPALIGADGEPVGERVFSGWMFASSPALNPLEHPVYDVWVIDCKTVLAAD